MPAQNVNGIYNQHLTNEVNPILMEDDQWCQEKKLRLQSFVLYLMLPSTAKERGSSMTYVALRLIAGDDFSSW